MSITIMPLPEFADVAHMCEFCATMTLVKITPLFSAYVCLECREDFVKDLDGVIGCRMRKNKRLSVRDLNQYGRQVEHKLLYGKK